MACSKATTYILYLTV